MAHITLSIDDDVLTAVQKHAVKENTSLDAMVRDYLTDLSNQVANEDDDRIEEARRAILELSERSKLRVGEITWTRDELYDR